MHTVKNLTLWLFVFFASLGVLKAQSIKQVVIDGVNPSGQLIKVSVDSSGALAGLGAGVPFLGDVGYLQQVQIMGVNPSGVVTPVSLDSTGAIRTTGGGGGGSFPATSGLVYNTSTTSSTTATPAQVVTALGSSASTTVNGQTCTLGSTCTVTAGVSTPTTGDFLSSTNTSGAVTTLIRNAGVNCIGDSYIQGVGQANQPRDGVCGRFLRDTPTPVWANYGVQGTTTPQIALSAFANATFNAYLPTVNLNDGGLNDGNLDACGGTAGTNCIKNYQLSLEALEAWESIPQTYKVFASAATATGTHGADSTVSIGTPVDTLSYGNAVALTSSGATLSFSIPTSASTRVGLTYAVTNGATGTFTVKVDGTNVTDFCSGTTTFSTGPCGGQSLTSNNGSASAPFRQEWTVTAGTAHTVLVTTGSATAVPIIEADWIPPSTVPNVNPVYMLSSPTTSGFSYTTVYSAASQTITNQLATDGLPVVFVDLTSGTPGANTAADYATSATTLCNASTSGGHPNGCGVEDIEKTILNAEATSHVQVSSYNAGGQVVGRTGSILTPLAINFGSPSSPTWAQVSQEMNLGKYNNPSMTWYDAGNGQKYGINGFLFDPTSGAPWSGKNGNYTANIGGYYFFETYDGSGTPGAAHYTPVGGVDLSNGNTAFNGFDARLQGATVASATTISLNGMLTEVSGTTALATINVPSDYTGNYGGCVQLIFDSAETTTTAGNIFAAYSLTAGLHTACYRATSSKWYIQ